MARNCFCSRAFVLHRHQEIEGRMALDVMEQFRAEMLQVGQDQGLAGLGARISAARSSSSMAAVVAVRAEVAVVKQTG